MFVPWTSASTGGKSGDMGTLRAGSPDRAVTGLATCVVVAADSEGIAEFADELLRSCPELTVLVTSREPINVPGEITWQVPPLGTDEALSLFAERAGHGPAVLRGGSGERTGHPVDVHSPLRHPLAVELALTPAAVAARG